MSNSLRDKVVVVTGASSGIGRSIALESASRGATVILMARHQDKLEEIANEARQLSGNEVYVFPTDISKADQIDRAFNEIVSHVDHIDYLVNAAGFGVFKEFLETSPQVVTEMFQTNVLGLMYFTRLVARVMIDQKQGQIINFGSIAGIVPTTKTAAYSATKAAIIQFSNVLRLELKPFGVKVMTVNPGPVYTNFFNIADESGSYVNNVQRFMLDPDDVAWQVVHFFGSNRRELNLPLSLATLAKLYKIFPRIGDWTSLKFASRKYGRMMNKQRNLVIGLIIVLVLVIFACLNTEPVAINFGFFQPKMPLIIVLVIMLLLGALVSLLIGKGEKVSPDVKKELAKQKKELDNKYRSETESR